MADVKGDVAGLALPGAGGEKIQQRVAQIGVEGYSPEANPVVFWDLYGKSGHPVRTTISEMGPTLLGRILDLSDAQVGALEVAFKLADDRGLLLLDLDDLRALLTFVAENRKEISAQLRPGERAVGRGDPARPADRSSAKAREALFGEPALELTDLLRTDLSGRGHHQRACRRSADSQAAAVFELPAVAVVRAVREPAGSRRSRQAEARVHLRRSAPAL